VAQNAPVHGNIPRLVDNIKPAVVAAKAKHPGLSGEAFVEEAVKANIWQGISDLLRTSAVTRERVKNGKLKIVGALYDIDSGKVEWLGSHPEQEQLLMKYGTEGGKPHRAKVKK
jgi:carbonic anhydrase